ncbi:50S ribosomal protein L11 methyltransferase [bacterium]|nr:50S ribosomal protein L11 methyltransferase [bacterium]
MNNQQQYYELRIEINPDMEDEISNMCFEMFDCDGVILEEEAYKDLEMVSTTKGTLKAFIKDNENVAERLQNARELMLSNGFSEDDLGSWNFTVTKIENEDWSKKWKEKWDVTHVTDKITVVPTWIDYEPKQDEVIIELDPGCAFGTGTHQTTQLCMKHLEKYMLKNADVADIGMGSGILSVLAKKLGANYVYGCDIDETVIQTAIDNAILNKCPDIVFELNTADSIIKKFDFVCANILHNVLAEIMGDLKNIMKDNAVLSLSGILDDKKPVVIEAVKNNNLNIIEELHQDQWTSFVVKKIS